MHVVVTVGRDSAKGRLESVTVCAGAGPDEQHRRVDVLCDLLEAVGDAVVRRLRTRFLEVSLGVVGRLLDFSTEFRTRRLGGKLVVGLNPLAPLGVGHTGRNEAHGDDFFVERFAVLDGARQCRFRRRRAIERNEKDHIRLYCVRDNQTNRTGENHRSPMLLVAVPEAVGMTAPVLDPTAANVERVADCVRDGGVVAAPTDTNMGLLLDPWYPAAVKRAFDIKDRSLSKPLTLFVRDPDDWRRFGTHDNPALVERVVDAFWPGPLNIVLERTEQVHDERLCLDSTVSVGCLSNPTWRALVAAIDRPVAMTSANRSGEADDRLVDTEFAREQVGDGVDLILAGEPQGTTTASTIVDLSGDPEIVRAGDITAADLNEAADLGV